MGPGSMPEYEDFCDEDGTPVIAYDYNSVWRLCPYCGHDVNGLYTLESRQPFTATDPQAGLEVWGPVDADKTIVCMIEGFVHFRIGDDIHQMAQMISPATLLPELTPEGEIPF